MKELQNTGMLYGEINPLFINCSIVRYQTINPVNAFRIENLTLEFNTLKFDAYIPKEYKDKQFRFKARCLGTKKKLIFITIDYYTINE